MKRAGRIARKMTLAAGLIAMAMPVWGQARTGAKPLAFDAVSVKPDNKETGPFTIGFPADGNGFSVTNIPLGYIIQFAYTFERGDLVQGLPDWARTERYDVEAKVADADLPAWNEMSDDLRRVMVQRILADRFKLAAHRDGTALVIDHVERPAGN